MATTEHTINDILARLLRNTRYVWRDSTVVSAENTGMIRGSNARPDILIIEPHASPVVIETEVLPAVTVEEEAKARLGEALRHEGSTILSAIALRLPVRLRHLQGDALDHELTTARDLEMALYTGNKPDSAERYPKAGWMIGNLGSLSMLAQSATIPPQIIDEAADVLITGISQAAVLIDWLAPSYQGTLEQMSRHLHQEDNAQTRRMAATIITNAFMFHAILARTTDELSDVYTIEELSAARKLTISSILTEWRKILDINYYPIFDIAQRLMAVIPVMHSGELIKRFTETSATLLQNRLMRSHDLTGAVFQKLITDRKFLAAFYTTPASAALLVGLAVTPEALPSGGSWANVDNLKALRIADFACGTGTLLSTTYQRIGQLHELAGGNAQALHQPMMEDVIVGCDILPAATHLTASMLAGFYPKVKFAGSSILTVAYGKQDDGGLALGSLDLLDAQGKFDILAPAAKALEGTGEKEKNAWRALPHAAFDLVIMNPPFTRATNHERKIPNAPNPMFAGLGSSPEEQRQMGDLVNKLTRGTSAHGNAGEASIFLVLADRKLKPHGVLALVMPLTLLSGSSWEKSRQLLTEQYSDLVVVTIAGAESAAMAFSSDTDMAECLIVARKTTREEKRAVFVILNQSPPYPVVGATAAEQILDLKHNHTLRRLEDGPMGGNTLQFGQDIIGQAIDAPLPTEGGWNLSRVADLSIAQSAYQLASNHQVWLPTQPKSAIRPIPMTVVSKMGDFGILDRDINGKNADGSIRGPFELKIVTPPSVPTYPILWAHEADRERMMIFEADREGIPYRGSSADEQSKIDDKVERIWQTASHCHFNRDFQFNSQSTGMQFTTRKTIGGRAWLSVQLQSTEHEKVLVLWANTSLGLLLHWWHASRQQAGRGIITKEKLASLPVLDVSALSPTQIATAVEIFDEMSLKPLLTFHEIDQDATRKVLDERFGKAVLGLPDSLFEEGGPFDLLRMKLAQEPSIRGAKK